MCVWYMWGGEVCFDNFPLWPPLFPLVVPSACPPFHTGAEREQATVQCSSFKVELVSLSVTSPAPSTSWHDVIPLYG